MRVTDQQGVEYEVTYDAEREVYVYMKVFKPWPEENFMGEPESSSNHGNPSRGQSEEEA